MYLSTCIYLSVYLCIYLSIYLSIYLPICRSTIYLSVYLSVCLSVCPSVCLSVCSYLSIYPSIYLYLSVSVYIHTTCVYPEVLTPTPQLLPLTFLKSSAASWRIFVEKDHAHICGALLGNALKPLLRHRGRSRYQVLRMMRSVGVLLEQSAATRGSGGWDNEDGGRSLVIGNCLRST